MKPQRLSAAAPEFVKRILAASLKQGLFFEALWVYMYLWFPLKDWRRDEEAGADGSERSRNHDKVKWRCLPAHLSV